VLRILNLAFSNLLNLVGIDGGHEFKFSTELSKIVLLNLVLNLADLNLVRTRSTTVDLGMAFFIKNLPALSHWQAGSCQCNVHASIMMVAQPQRSYRY